MWWNMIDTFVKAPKTTGAISKYSWSSIKDIFQEINRSYAKLIIEFWPWDGNITKQILKNMHSDGKLICFEINKQDFESYLKKIHDPRLTVHYLSCEEIDQYVENNSVDIIISTIPFSFIPNTIVESIITKSYQSLKVEGKFITGQYSAYAKKFLTPNFWTIAQRRHLRNLPPVCILTATK